MYFSPLDLFVLMHLVSLRALQLEALIDLDSRVRNQLPHI